MKIELFRMEYEEKQTLGQCAITDNGKDIFLAKSLERADNNNQRNISCIPQGEYLCVLEYSNKFDCDLWEIKGLKLSKEEPKEAVEVELSAEPEVEGISHNPENASSKKELHLHAQRAKNTIQNRIFNTINK